MRKQFFIIVIGLLLFGCGHGDRTVVIQNECIDDLPNYLHGRYWLNRLEVHSTKKDVTTRRTSIPIWGLLTINDNGFFHMDIRKGVYKQDTQGYYDVKFGIMFVYTTDEYDDIMVTYQYHYTKNNITLEFYDRRFNRRFVSLWSNFAPSIGEDS